MNPIKTHPQRPAPARRGSVLILTIVVIVLMAILGATYIQVTRVQRLAVSERKDNLGEVMDSIRLEIATTLRDDLTADKNPNNAGQRDFFHGSLVTSSDLIPAGGGDEFHDFPYTHSWSGEVGREYGSRYYARGIRGYVRNPDDASAPPIPATGGLGDDPWLASTNGTGGGWPHISNLKGYGLAYNIENDGDPAQPDFDLDLDLNDGLPAEIVISNRSNSDSSSDDPPNERWDTDVPYVTDADGDSRLVDADGDGIPDSRWVWAPIPSKDGVYYMYAVRIVDLSSLLNVNVATSLRYANGAFDPQTDAPRFLSPADLDLYDAIVTPGGPPEELAALLDYRGFNIDPLAPETLVPANQRWVAWDTGFASPLVRLDVANEFDLRFRNGLNGSKILGTPIDALGIGLHTFLRADDPAITDTQDFTDDPAGGTPANADPGTEGTYFTGNPRLKFTTFSGARQFARPNLKEQGTASPFFYRQNLNAASILADPATGIELVRDAVLTSYAWSTDPVNTANAPPSQADYDLPRLPPTITAEEPPAYDDPVADKHAYAARIVEFAYQFAANVADYRDLDNWITQTTGADLTLDTPDDVYGLEALPHIAELYVQRPYRLDVSNEFPGGAPGLGWGLKWERTGLAPGGESGYAIEIRNPHRKPIRLTDVFLHIAGYDDPATAGIDEKANPELAEPWGDPADDPADRDLDSFAGDAVEAFNRVKYNGGAPIPDNPATPGVDGRMLFPGDAIVLYRNSDIDGTETPEDDVTLLVDDVPAGTRILVPLGVPGPTPVWWHAWPSINDNLDNSVSRPIDLDVDLRVFGIGDTNPRLDRDWFFVELRAKVNDTDKMPFGYSRAASVVIPDEYFETVDSFNDGASPNADPMNGPFVLPRYLQWASVGNGAGINTLAMSEGILPTNNQAVAGPPAVPADPPGRPAESDYDYRPNSPSELYNATTLEELGEELKPAPSGSPPNRDRVAPLYNQFVFADGFNGDLDLDFNGTPDGPSVRMPHLGDLAHIAVIGPRSSAVVGEEKSVGMMWHEAEARLVAASQTLEGTGTGFEAQSGVRKFMLDFDYMREPTDENGQWVPANYASTPSLMTHAALLMSRLTTFDGPTVEGTLNINTVSREVLEAALPIANPTTRTAVVDAIFAYRGSRGVLLTKNTNTPISREKDAPGVFDLWQLAPELRQLMDTTDNQLFNPGGIRIDYTGNPIVGTPTNIVYADDLITDDREEEALLMKWLTQVATVRSDRFVAFVVVRGYKTGQWEAPVESARFFQIYDRANDEAGQPIPWEDPAEDSMPAYPDTWMYRY